MLTVTNVSKSFLSNQVLKNVDFDVRAGEVHALIGENGAGKSTLVNLIAGIHQRDSGTIEFNGQQVSFSHPLEAIKVGINVVHQELSLVPNITVAENIYLRREKTTGLGFNDWKAMTQHTKAVFDRIGIDIDPNALVGSLSVGMRQLVEVTKALAFDAKLIIMDEPTSSLSEKEIRELFKVIENLKTRGMAIIFISHKLSELFDISDRISVLRDGQLIATRNTKDLVPDEVIRMMVGRHLTDLFPPRASTVSDVAFRCEDLSCYGTVRKVDFEVRHGEIVGIAGLIGSGRTEAMRALINADSRASGRFFLDGKEIKIEDPSEAIKQGIVYLSEDRKGSGLFLSYDVSENVCASTLKRYASRFGFLNSTAMHRRAREFIDRLDIRPANDRARVLTLSGGNQQKVLLSKALDVNLKLLIVDEPTRGVDVGAKSLIHAQLRNLAETGVAVIMVSSELPEIIGLSDRILVFRNGGISVELDNRNGTITQEVILNQAFIH